MPSSSNARSLLAYLVLHHDRPISRDRLAGIFWPDRPDTRARHALSHALWQIRSALDSAADRLTAERQEVTFELRAGDHLDVAEFEQLADGVGLQSLITAADLYRVDFLEGIYDDWGLLERERLREIYLRVLARLVARYKQQEGYEQALVYAQRLVAADPLHEKAHCEVMRLYHLLGRSQAALEQFADLSDLLEKEMGLSPTPATVSLSQEIARDLATASEKDVTLHLLAAPPPPPLLRGLAHLPLVGRADERTMLLHGLQTTVQGRGGHALIEGDAGVGKTRLVSEVVADAQWRGFQVGLAKAEHLAASRPYHLLREALSPLLTPLRVAQLAELVEPVWLAAAASIFPAMAEHLPDLGTLPHIDPQQEQQRLWEGIRRCVMGLAMLSPLLLVLEDLQWADETTLTALPHLAPNLPAGRAFVIFTARTAEARQRAAVWETLEALDQAVPLLRVGLQPFDSAETVALVRRALGAAEANAESAVFGQRLQDKTGGNVLFLVETLKSLLERGDLAPVSEPLSEEHPAIAEWRFPAEDLPLATPTSVRELVSERMARLPVELRAVLEQVAVVGERVEFPVLAYAGDGEPTALLALLEKLKQRGFLLETTEHYCFEHDSIREIAYRAIPADRRQVLHRSAGVVMEALHPEQVEALAYHFSHGEVWDRAVTYNLKAGRQAQATHAPHTAWRCYSRVLEILDSQRPFPEPQAADLAFQARAARHELAWMSGDVDQERADIEALLQLAAQLSDPERRAEALNQQSFFLCQTQDEYEQARQVARTALALAQEHDLPRQAAIALRNGGQACHRSGLYREAEEALQQSLANWEALGETSVQVAETQIYLAQIYEQTGDIDDAEALGHRAVATAQAADAPLTVARAYALLARLAYRQARHRACIRYHQDSLEQIRKIGHKQNEAVELSNLGIVYWSLRDYGRAILLTQQGLEIYRQIGNRRGIIGAMDNLSGIYLEIGRHAEAQEAIEEGLTQAEQIDFPHTEALLLVTQGRLYLDQGDVDAAERAIRRAQQVARTIAAPYVSGLVHLAWGMLWWAREDAVRADRHFAYALQDFQAAGEADFATAARSFWALSQHARGNLEQAISLSTQAVKELEATPGGEHIQDIYLHHWRILRAAGRGEEACAALEKAFRSVQAQVEKLPDLEWQHDFLTKVPVNREIMVSWEAIRPQVKTCHLPAADAPTSRPLREDELVDVSWTIATPEDDEIAGKVARRRHRLLRLLRQAAEQGAAPTVVNLATALDVGERTIKRDLAALRAEGRDVSTRGS